MSSIFFSGCDELEELTKEDYITVTVNCNAQVFVKYKNDPDNNLPVIDAFVDITIVKAGGERIDKKEKTGYWGATETVTKTFKLYKEQPIDCYANIDLPSVADNYPNFIFNSERKTILWDDIYPSTDFGESTTRTLLLTIHGTEQ